MCDSAGVQQRHQDDGDDRMGENGSIPELVLMSDADEEMQVDVLGE